MFNFGRKNEIKVRWKNKTMTLDEIMVEELLSSKAFYKSESERFERLAHDYAICLGDLRDRLEAANNKLKEYGHPGGF